MLDYSYYNEGLKVYLGNSRPSPDYIVQISLNDAELHLNKNYTEDESSYEYYDVLGRSVKRSDKGILIIKNGENVVKRISR